MQSVDAGYEVESARLSHPAFSPSRLTATVQAMADAQHDDVDQQAIRAAQETLATCATRLDRYRAALDSGTDPTFVSRWIADVQAEQVTAEATLRRLTGRRTMNRRIVETLGNITAVLRDADPADKALIYHELGLTLTYRPTARTVSAQATPSGAGDICPVVSGGSANRARPPTRVFTDVDSVGG